MRIKRITAILLIGLIFVLTACAGSTATPLPKSGTSPPNLTAAQAEGIVASAIRASTPDVQRSAVCFDSAFNYSNRQWMVTVWPSNEDESKQYLGYVYVVDDATGKLLNPPPVYTPK